MSEYINSLIDAIEADDRVAVEHQAPADSFEQAQEFIRDER